MHRSTLLPSSARIMLVCSSCSPCSPCSSWSRDRIGFGCFGGFLVETGEVAQAQAFAREEDDAEQHLREELRRVHENRIADRRRAVDAVDLLERDLAAPLELADERRRRRECDCERNDRRYGDPAADERDVDAGRAKPDRE